MFKRLMIAMVIVSAACTLHNSQALGQSKEEGIRLYQEANELRRKAHTRQDLEKVVQKYEKAQTIFEQTRFEPMIGAVANNIGLVYRDWGQYAKATEYFNKSLEIARKIGDLKLELRPLSGLGNVYRLVGEYAKAEECFNKSLEIARKIGEVQSEGVMLTNLGSVFGQTGQYAKAEDHLNKSLEIQRRGGDVKGEGITLNNVANVYRDWGQYSKAEEYFSKSLEIMRRIGATNLEGQALMNLGMVYSNWGHYAKAVDYYEKSLEIARKTGDVKSEGDTLTNLGIAYSGKGQYSEALANYKRALETYKKAGMPTRLPTAMIGHLYVDMGDLKKAEQYVKEAGFIGLLGRFYLLKSNYSAAKTEYEKELSYGEKSGNADSLFAAYTGLGRVHEALEDYKKAEEFYEKGMKLTEEIRSSLPPSERTSFFEVKIGGFARSEPAKGLTRVRMKLNEASESIDSSEVTRARAFSDGMFRRTEVGYSGVPKDVLAKEDELVTRVAALKKDRSKQEKDKDPTRYENITKEIQKTEAELNNFVEMLWDKHKAYASVKHPRPVTLKEASVRPEEHVIIFDVVTEGVGVKLVKGKEIVQTFYTKLKSDDLEKDVKKFRQPFEEVKLKAFDPELGQKLYKKLLLPLLSQVPEGVPITIIPDGILAVLPFEALVVSGKPSWKKGAKGEYPEGVTYVGDLYPVSYYQSITALTLARTIGEKKKAGDRLLVIADPVFQLQDVRAQATKQTQVAGKDKEYYPNLMTTIEESSAGAFKFARLAETEALAKGLGNIYGGKSEVLTGLQANKSHLVGDLAPTLDRYNGVVFATHGLFSTKIPGIQEPFLALTMVPPGTDGFLTMTDVMGLKMNADIVALTACQTGLGKELSGEGIMSMGRAFQYAGAKSVLMSLWSVAEKSSVDLVESFFKHLKQGKNKLEALKLARDDIRKAGYDHPFFWAPFILVGETD